MLAEHWPKQRFCFSDDSEIWGTSLTSYNKNDTEEMETSQMLKQCFIQ